MAKIRIYEWAKENKLSSAVLVKELNKNGYNVRNHTTPVEENVLKNLFLKDKEKANSTTFEKNNSKPEIKEQPKHNRFVKSDNKNKPEYKKKLTNKSTQNKSTNGTGFKKTFPTSANSQGNKNSFTASSTNTKVKEEVTPIETKDTTKKKKQVHNQTKKKTYDRFKFFDKEEKSELIDGKTKTQIKKEAREERQKNKKEEKTILNWTDDMTVSKFATSIDIPVTDVVTKLFELGILATVNQNLSQDVAEILCDEYNVEIVEDQTNLELEFDNLLPDLKKYETKKRPPIVTIMGHVDHGKTTLLDTLRNLNINVADKEAGGITQHIGAYQIIAKNGEKITFLDTPGHEAFTQMRARGANITDITILVVAADDGIMPQTVEAIQHAKSAKTPIIVAVNKIDKPEANVEKVLSGLAENGIMAEEWGGDVPVLKISALKNQGIDELLDYIKLLSDLNDYQAPFEGPGIGTVIESNLDKGKGAVATILLEKGKLNVKDSIVIGNTWGTIRSLVDEYGKKHKTIEPSMPVEITGLKDVPEAGERFFVANGAKEAQDIGEKRAQIQKTKDRGSSHALSLEELNNLIEKGDIKELPVIIKSDVHGSTEALSASLEKIEVSGVKVRVVAKGVGAITESDVLLASADNTIIIGFNVRPDAGARKKIEKEGITLITNNIIYKIIEQIEDSMQGMQEKKYTEEVIGTAEVQEVFKITGVGKVAGALVTSGKINKSSKMRLIRDGVVLYDGDIGQLKRYQDNVEEVINGQDFGVSFAKYSELKKGDELEAYKVEEIEQ